MAILRQSQRDAGLSVKAKFRLIVFRLEFASMVLNFDLLPVVGFFFPLAALQSLKNFRMGSLCPSPFLPANPHLGVWNV